MLARTAECRMSAFNGQNLANAAWAFAKVGHLDDMLSAAFVAAAEQQVSKFNGQGLADTAWALAVMGRSEMLLFAAIASEAPRRLPDLCQERLCMMLWALSQCNNLGCTWNLLKHAQCSVHGFGPLLFGAVVMECEQRGLRDCEIALLNRWQCFGKSACEVDFAAVVRGAVTVCLAELD
eukprot:gnl/TRDRNA2_/TRDRNA2_88027_c0_seq1.p2 gnl/TRDRNA2_/TRDRNA2_88027_c0~~gnl/TRDRNA2_/TRDRNA2_88027_c0_seq1.p2  ORF type:complete len:179 (+),score=31.62 gnl/TRDRNA2_/TRDRNA2_88027_c0_seq1:184-720(+)